METLVLNAKQNNKLSRIQGMKSLLLGLSAIALMLALVLAAIDAGATPDSFY